MNFRYDLKQLLVLLTLVAIASTIIGTLGLFWLILLILLATWFVPVKSFGTHWWSLMSAAFICYLIYEATIPAGMNIRGDILLLFAIVVFSMLLQIAKLGDLGLERRRYAKSQRSKQKPNCSQTADEHSQR